MSQETPTVYILHGDDLHKAEEMLAAMRERLGDPSTAEMNISVFEGAGIQFPEVESAVVSAPFLAPRRIVVLRDFLGRLNSKDKQKRLTSLLERVPPTTACVIHETRSLTRDERGKERKKAHWLLDWAGKTQKSIYIEEMALPQGREMVNWIRKQAKKLGGEIEPYAASMLAEYVDSSTMQAENELEKLLAYVNYARPVEADDVEFFGLTTSGKGDYFALTDALSTGDRRKAQRMVVLLGQEQDPMMIFFGIVGHFRVLLQAREVIDEGGSEQDVQQKLRMHPFRAKKLYAQARKFSLDTLIRLYQRFSEQDYMFKTGAADAGLILEMLAAEFLGQSA